MANKKITTTITQFPTAPDSKTDSEAEFNAKADAFVAHQAGAYTPEVNAWATEANALVVGVNHDATNAHKDMLEAKKQAGIATGATSQVLPPLAGNAGKTLQVNANATDTVWQKPTNVGFLALSGGTMTGNLNVKSHDNAGGIYVFSPLEPTRYVFKLGYKSSGEGALYSNKTGQVITYKLNGDIEIDPKSGKKLLYNGVEVATVGSGNYLSTHGGTITGAISSTDIDPLRVYKTGWANKGYIGISGGEFAIAKTAGGKMQLKEDGSINITPKSGKKLYYKGVEVATVEGIRGYNYSATGDIDLAPKVGKAVKMPTLVVGYSGTTPHDGIKIQENSIDFFATNANRFRINLDGNGENLYMNMRDGNDQEVGDALSVSATGVWKIGGKEIMTK